MAMPDPSADSGLVSAALAPTQDIHEQTPLLDSINQRRGSTDSLRPDSENQRRLKAPDEDSGREVGLRSRKYDASSESVPGIAGMISVLLLGALFYGHEGLPWSV